MSKYNRILSIPVSDIPKSEIKRAIKEWAEGNKEMENLLTTFYDNKIETCGCHVGPSSYIDFRVGNNQKKVVHFLNNASNYDSWLILVSPDGGNPFSGPNFYKPSICLGFETSTEEELSSILEKINNSFTDTSRIENNNLFNTIVKLHDFFAYKESNINFRFKKENGIYIFSIEARKKSIPNFRKLKKLLNKCGLPHAKVHGYEWFFASNSFEVFEDGINKILEMFLNNWTFDIYDSINDKMDIITMARIKRRIVSAEEFKEWLDLKRKDIFKVKKPVFKKLVNLKLAYKNEKVKSQIDRCIKKSLEMNEHL